MLKCTACGKYKSKGESLMKMSGDWTCLRCQKITLLDERLVSAVDCPRYEY